MYNLIGEITESKIYEQSFKSGKKNVLNLMVRYKASLPETSLLYSPKHNTVNVLIVCEDFEFDNLVSYCRKNAKRMENTNDPSKKPRACGALNGKWFAFKLAKKEENVGGFMPTYKISGPDGMAEIPESKQKYYFNENGIQVITAAERKNRSSSKPVAME